MRFVLGIVLGFFLLSNLYGRGGFHVHRSFDLDNNGQKEVLVLNTSNLSAIWIETHSSTGNDTLWSYSLVNGGTFADGEVVDINNDDFLDLILIPNLNVEIGEQVWFYLFLGNDAGFSNDPLTIEESLLDLTTIRPSNLSLVPGGIPKLAVSFGSPVRKGMVFDIEISNNTAYIKTPQLLSAPIISNGYGAVYIGGFKSNGAHYVTLLSPERGQLKLAVFDVGQSFDLLQSKTIKTEDARYLLGKDIQPTLSNLSQESGLLVPFGSDEVFLLSVIDGDAVLSNTSLSGLGAFSPKEDQNLLSILQSREKADILEAQQTISVFNDSRSEASALQPPAAVFPDESATLNTVLFDYEKDVTIPSASQKRTYKDFEISKNKRDYSGLAPTLSDFLESVKSESVPTDEKNQQATSVPLMNEDMMSVNWADEAGFTQLELGEYIPEVSDTVAVSPIPEKDSGIATFTQEAIDSIKIKSTTDDSLQVINASSGIELYYVLAMTPVSENKDRYVFDGEAPFGIAVNQIPAVGNATHLQHGVSADLSILQEGETYDFAYSLRDARLDSITTLTMVHDMQTNVVFMSISPTDDSLSQSYQPESFDPKLFEFPDYFFEGFPNSLNMDFTDKLIRFSFQGDKDSTYQGIYLSSTTPSDPSQSLAVFMDQGTLQSIRGEIVVRPNGSKKITTEYDLVGTTEPSVMFSRLIQEMFPEELKVKLLQGAYLEQPLFGPTGKLPKVTREPRLPEVQPDQVETSIPVEPKQSNVPETVIDSIATKSDSSIINPDTQQDEINPSVLELEKIAPEDSVQVDSLKLETKKEIKESPEERTPPSAEESQPDQESLKEDSKKQKDLKVEPVKADSTKVKESKEEKENKIEESPADSTINTNDI
tara:strand:- start:3374 stop:6013 length:2640 start_codon:yes stop_codon:yes gene_type:complete